tara:strand:- start:6119 stop:7036 length:918 start_codon:yes stop_codon:yes gene_type:complete
MKKNILVTGGLGFIGSHLVDKLIDEGNSVVVIDDLSTGSKKNLNKKAKYLKIDIKKFINNITKIKKIILDNKINSVFHLAAHASINSNIANPLSIIEVNFNASVAIVEACKNSSVKYFTFTSTAAVYGEPQYFPVDEKHITNPISTYGLSKLMFEQYLKIFSIKSKIKIMILRLPNVYGFRQRSDLEGGVIAIFSEKMKKNKMIKIFGNGKQKRDWVHVSDIVNAAASVSNFNHKFETIVLGSLTGNSINTLIKKLAKIYNYKKEPKVLKKRDNDIKYMLMSNFRAKKKIDWSPKISLDKGLKML